MISLKSSFYNSVGLQGKRVRGNKTPGSWHRQCVIVKKMKGILSLFYLFEFKNKYYIFIVIAIDYLHKNIWICKYLSSDWKISLYCALKFSRFKSNIRWRCCVAQEESVVKHHWRRQVAGISEDHLSLRLYCCHYPAIYLHCACALLFSNV